MEAIKITTTLFAMTSEQAAQISHEPPLPPPPPPAPIRSSITSKAPGPPAVSKHGPPGAFLVELLTFSGSPFNDHWAYWIPSRADPDIGLELHATGDVRNGFRLEIKRSYDLSEPGNEPTKRIPLQWVDGVNLDEDAIFNGGVFKFDDTPICEFERCAFKVDAPGKSLNDESSSGRKITQRDCQTWIVESAQQLVKDGIFEEPVLAYLRATAQSLPRI